MVTDETFFAWLDGELAPDEAARVGAEVAADPRLSALAADHRAMQARLKGAFDPLLDRPLPDALKAAVRSDPRSDVVDLAQAKARRDDARRWRSAPQWAAMAATLAVGILIGAIVPHRRDGGPVEVRGGKMYAAAALNLALDKQLASAPAGDVRIGVTFRDQAGAICRTFTATASSGLACKENGRWQMRGLFAPPEARASNYRMAAGMDPNLAALVDSTIAGDPLDAAGEKAAQANGWR
jgi:hypothetical protein